MTSEVKLSAASGGGSISLKGPSSAGSDTDFLDTSGNLKVTGNTTVDGKILIGTTTALGSNADDLNIKTTGNTGISIQSGTSSTGNIYFADGTSGTDLYRGAISYNHSGDAFTFGTANTTALSIDSSGNIEANVGNIVISTSGKGIDFSATGDGTGTSSVSELLDDYEEGQWTPGVSHDSTSYISGHYTKIGDMVYASFEVTFGSSSTSSHQSITGLPFTPGNDENGAVAKGYTSYNAATLVYHISKNDSKIYMYKGSGSAVVNLDADEISSNNCRGVAVYKAA